jgi:glycosyltransferase involved in cell wall biosynthesis
MRIGVNALYLIPGGVGGTEIYLRWLLAALAEIDRHNDYFVFTNRETGTDLVPAQSNFTHVPQGVRAANRPARLLWEQTMLPLAAARWRLDVLFNPGFTAAILCGCPQVTVFHDLQHKRHPEYFRWFDLPFWTFFLFWSVTVSRLIVAVSGATADDLRRWYRLPEAKIRTVPSGVDPVFFDLAARRRPEPFLLAVSTLHPHKNLDGLLRAFATFRQRHPEYRLIVSGLHGFSSAELHALRERLGLTDCVEFPGWIAREALYDLYARAAAFLYPSLFEGFGLPVLEALAAGVPTGCSGVEPMNSIAADAALKFDPRDPVAIAEAMHRLVTDVDLQVRLAAAGPRRAAQFSWRSTAEAVLEACSSVR